LSFLTFKLKEYFNNKLFINTIGLRGIELLFLGVGAILGAFVRFKITSSPSFLGPLPQMYY
jgi:hypothetical protein